MEFVLLQFERTTRVFEVLGTHAQDFWQNSCNVEVWVIVLEVGAVGEDVFLGRMAMQIQEYIEIVSIL